MNHTETEKKPNFWQNRLHLQEKLRDGGKLTVAIPYMRPEETLDASMGPSGSYPAALGMIYRHSGVATSWTPTMISLKKLGLKEDAKEEEINARVESYKEDAPKLYERLRNELIEQARNAVRKADMVAIPGSDAHETLQNNVDEVYLAMLDEAVKENKPVVAVCRGGAMMWRYAGGEVDDLPTESLAEHYDTSRMPEYSDGKVDRVPGGKLEKLRESVRPDGDHALLMTQLKHPKAYSEKEIPANRFDNESSHEEASTHEVFFEKQLKDSVFTEAMDALYDKKWREEPLQVHSRHLQVPVERDIEGIDVIARDKDGRPEIITFEDHPNMVGFMSHAETLSGAGAFLRGRQDGESRPFLHAVIEKQVQEVRDRKGLPSQRGGDVPARP